MLNKLAYIILLTNYALADDGSCGLDFTGSDLHDGSTEDTRFPWLGILNKKQTMDSLLTSNVGKAVLIGNKHLLTTTAIASEKNKLDSVILGAYNLSDKSDTWLRANIQKFTLHPQWNPISHENDIAIIELEEPVQFNKYIQPICLPQGKTDYTNDKLFFGTFNERGLYTQSEKYVKMAVLFPIVDIEKCQALYEKLKLNAEIHLCAGEKSKDTCNGDGGGALVRKVGTTYEAVALSSFGFTPCGVKPSIYTRIDHYLDWIKNTMQL